MDVGEVTAPPRAGVSIVRSSPEKLERVAAWYAAEHERLIRFAYLLTRDNEAAEDLVQEAFLKIYKAGAQLEEQGLPAYARQTIVNLARSAFRRRTIERRALETVGPAQASAVQDPAAGVDVREALLRLSVSDRAALVLRYYEGQTDREIAATLGISDSAAKKRVERAHARLRALLAKEE